MDHLNWYIIFIAALIPLITGFIWYHPRLFGTAWMNAAGVTPDSAKGANMALTFFLTYLLGCFIAAGMAPIVIHQFGFSSMMLSVPGIQDPATENGQMFKHIMDLYGNNFRTFRHGALHGTLTGIFLGLPLIAINAMFERKKAKYIFINSGYWTLTLLLMGGVICAFM